MRKIISLLMVVIMAVTIYSPIVVSADTITAKTPTDTAGLKWKAKFGEGYANAPTPPLIKGNYLYIGAGYHIYRVDKNTGAVIGKSGKLEGSMGYATNPPVEGDGKIFITVGSGKVQALDINTLSVLWTSKTTGKDPETGNDVNVSGQTISPLVYNNGNLYTGTYGNKGGQFFCIDTKSSDGRLKWAIQRGEGFYWSGAYATDHYAVFGTDSDDSGKSLIMSVNPNTGSLISSMSAIGGISSTIIKDDNNYLYAATRGSKLYKIKMNVDGTINSWTSCDISGATTGTPTIFQNKIYIGTSKSKIDVINTSDLSSSHSISTKGYPQGGVLISASNGSNYLYSTYNSMPGGIIMAELDKSPVTVHDNFFVPADSQYCLSPIIADEASGVLYYKNDSCYLMAVDTAANAYTEPPSVKNNSYNSLKIAWTATSNATGYHLYRSQSKSGNYTLVKAFDGAARSYIDTGLKTGTAYYYKLKATYTGVKGTKVDGMFSAESNGKPVLSKPKVSTYKKKKSIKVSWKKVSGASGYTIYRSTKKKGKYKKVKTIKKGSTKSWTNKKLKSKKKYYYKIKAFRKVGGKKVYSVYSNISYKKIK